MSLATVAATAIICQLPRTLSFFFVPIAALSFAAGSIIVLGTTTFLVAKKRPRTGASISLDCSAPSDTLVADDPSRRVRAPWAYSGIWGRSAWLLFVEREWFHCHDWSVGLAGANTFLIHDVTDEIALPLSKHTHP